MKTASPPAGFQRRPAPLIVLAVCALLLNAGVTVAAPPVMGQSVIPANPTPAAGLEKPASKIPGAQTETRPASLPDKLPEVPITQQGPTQQVEPTAGAPASEGPRPEGDSLRLLVIPAGSDPIVMGVSTRPERLIPGHWQQFPTGAYNAITDVPGIQVGHLSLYRDRPNKIRTGVTAIVPDATLLTGGKGNLATTGFRASAVMLNGNGELTGMGPLQTAGILNSPIILTNTYAVGAAHQGVFEYFAQHYPGQWEGQLPVVGECWDGFFNTIEEPVQAAQDTVMAIESARSGVVPQGRVGAGTGMRSFELHAGIGSASRRVVVNNREYTIGVLVNANHSKLNTLNPLLKTALERSWSMPVERMRTADSADEAVRPSTTGTHPESRQGSAIVVIATDLPLDAQALRQVAQRAALGIGNTGSIMATTSGDFAIAFSTASPLPLGAQAPAVLSLSVIHPDALTPILQATVEAVTEAQLNAIVAAHATRVPAYGP
ncbi:MAG TPA: P1 family peptidase [Coleofasciculaceae cyanobacterium]|jgi:D-aminopeptidase